MRGLFAQKLPGQGTR